MIKLITLHANDLSTKENKKLLSGSIDCRYHLSIFTLNRNLSKFNSYFQNQLF